MFSKKTYILVGIFIFLIGAVFLTKTTPWEKTIKQNNPIFFDIVKEDVDKIVIIKDSKSTILGRENNSWLVVSEDNFRADQDIVENMLNNIFSIKDFTLISENSKKLSIYGMTDSKIEVKLFKGSIVLTHFIVGKNGSVFNSSYVKLNNDNKIYLASGDMRRDFSLPDYKEKQEDDVVEEDKEIKE